MSLNIPNQCIEPQWYLTMIPMILRELVEDIQLVHAPNFNLREFQQPERSCT